MKRHLIFSILFLSTIMLLFSCKKDEVKPSAQNLRTIHILSEKSGGVCTNGWGICIDSRPKDFPPYLLELNEVLVNGTIEEDGSLLLKGTVSQKQLSDEAIRQWLGDRKLIVNNDIELDPELVREAFANSGKQYNGQTYVIPAGEYDLNVTQHGDPSSNKTSATVSVTACKTLFGVRICVTIEITITFDK